ncbi:ATP-binding protein [Limnoglobus roseus]|uniref:ATP-binding protein n=1 Tax=Limnoglobus roseus TaxID=2598579 RepID=UPI00143DD441|nr:ATP-binding protein [Limnoglobus roseus]
MVTVACWATEAVLFHGPIPLEHTWNPLVGIALGGLLTGGRRLGPAILLGFWGARLAAVGSFDPADLFGLKTAVYYTLQALIGAILVRQFCSRPLALIRFREIVFFLLMSGPLSCLVVASLRAVGGEFPTVDPITDWLRTWAGDALGGMLVTPVSLALFARPRDIWQPRLRTVAVPLVLIACAVTGLHQLGLKGDQSRTERHLKQTTDILAVDLEAEGQRLGTLLGIYQTWIGSKVATTADQQALVRGRVKEFRALFPAADDLFAIPEERPPPEYQDAIRRATEVRGVGAGPIRGQASSRFAVVVRMTVSARPEVAGYLGCWVDPKRLIEETRAIQNHHLSALLIEPTTAAEDLVPDRANYLTRKVTFANRTWQLVVAADADYRQTRPMPYTWLALGISLIGTVLLASLLLSLTGQTAIVRAEVERAARELSALHRERAAVEAALYEARRDAALGRLAGGVAHEFNNLFTGILGHAARARELLVESHPSQMELRKAEQAVARASELCQQILAFTGKGTIVRQPLPLHEFLPTVAANVRPRLAFSPEIEIVPPPAPVVLVADALLLRRLVTNLLLNAAEAYSGPGGRIVVQYGCSPDDLVWLRVEDFGTGMPPDVLAAAFDPFFSTKGPGRGLGLSAVRGVAHTHGGLVTVASEVGVGTTVSVQLVNKPQSDPACTPPPSREPTVPHWSGLFLPPAITDGLTLIVDDDATVRELAAATLRGAGCEVLTAENGEEGLDLYRCHADRVRLVVLDLLMPVMDGGTTLQRLRQLSATLPVIVMSAYSDLDLSEEFASGSPVVLLNKPFRPTELLSLAAGFFAAKV